MTKFLHKLSAFLFFLLGISLFVAFLLWRNEIYTEYSMWWLQRADLPFALAAILFGGTSLFRSLNPKEKRSPILAIAIAIPLIAFFIFLVMLNFWGVFPLPQGNAMI
jgi:hypothetical protein